MHVDDYLHMGKLYHCIQLLKQYFVRRESLPKISSICSRFLYKALCNSNSINNIQECQI